MLNVVLLPAETTGWETPALNLRWSQEKTRRVNTWWFVGSILCVVGVSKPSTSSALWEQWDRPCVFIEHVAFSNSFFKMYSFIYYHLLSFSPGKNKRVGKQLASQKILQMLHPHVKNWGSLLRMYGRESNKMVKKVCTLSATCYKTCVLIDDFTTEVCFCFCFAFSFKVNI